MAGIPASPVGANRDFPALGGTALVGIQSWRHPGQRTDGAATGEAIEQGCPEFREQYARTREAQPDLKSKWAPLVTIFQILAKHGPGAMRAMGSLPVTPRPATTRLLAVCLATGNKPVAKGGHETLPHLARCLQN